MQMLACFSNKGCPQPLIDSTIGHYSLWSAFLSSVQQGRAMECDFVTLNSMSTHGHTNWKYTGSLQNMDASEIWIRIFHLVFKHSLLIVIVTTCDLVYFAPSMLHHFGGWMQ